MKNILLTITILSSLILIGACGQTDEKKATGEAKETVEKTDYVTPEEASQNALRAGDKVPQFELSDAKGETVKSNELLEESNLVIVFYRGEWCPYCNNYLKRLQSNNDKFIENNGKLVAISAESPDDSLSLAEKNNLEFTVLSDKNLDLARKFRIVYELPAKTNEEYKENGIDLIKENGTLKPELPLSATYIVNQDGEITFAFLDPDYTKRLEADDIIAELKKIS